MLYPESTTLGGMRPFAERRDAILKEIDDRTGLPVNIKWCIQLKDGTNQKSKDINRLIKDGVLKLERRGSARPGRPAKNVSYVVRA